jgi:two-component system, NarL family, nitrate/nitrite response regulator NarL
MAGRNMPRSNARADGLEPVSALLMSPVRLYRDALVALLNRQADIRAVGCVGLTDEVLAELGSASRTLLLLDMGYPEAVALADQAIKERPGIKILGFGVDEVAPRVVACAEAGLRGYVPAHASIADLAKAIRRVASGDTVCSAEMAGSLFQYLGSKARCDAPAAVDAALTPRQRQVLRLIKDGFSNKEIARQLALGPSTVKNHVHALLGRLQVGHRGEAAGRLSGKARSEIIAERPSEGA